VIEAERKDYRGDAAIDDLKLLGCLSQEASGSPKVVPTTTTARPRMSLNVPPTKADPTKVTRELNTNEPKLPGAESGYFFVLQ